MGNTNSKYACVNQYDCIELFNKLYGCNCLEFSNQYEAIDAIDKNNKILLEVKNRNCFKNQYNKTIVGLNKVNEFRDKYMNDGYSFFIAVCWLDKWSVYKWNEDECAVLSSSNKHMDIKGVDECAWLEPKKPHYFIPHTFFDTLKDTGVRKPHSRCLLQLTDNEKLQLGIE